jgi:hypothetical protein
MNPEVLACWDSFTDPLEGELGYLYTDRYSLVTCGRGNLVDDGQRREHAGDPLGAATGPGPALSLGWHVSVTDATLASPDAIRAAWWAVKNAWPSVQSVACAPLTTIRLYPADIDRLTDAKLAELWADLVRRFPAAESWPACAQLGALSMSWAMGGSFEGMFPKFDAAALAQDWTTCAAECQMSNGSLARNADNRKLFLGAAAGVTIAAALGTGGLA